eukprot:1140303-Pelagomonas_calceolata.AAC.1
MREERLWGGGLCRERALWMRFKSSLNFLVLYEVELTRVDTDQLPIGGHACNNRAVVRYLLGEEVKAYGAVSNTRLECICTSMASVPVVGSTGMNLSFHRDLGLENFKMSHDFEICVLQAQRIFTSGLLCLEKKVSVGHRALHPKPIILLPRNSSRAVLCAS